MSVSWPVLSPRRPHGNDGRRKAKLGPTFGGSDLPEVHFSFPTHHTQKLAMSENLMSRSPATMTSRSLPPRMIRHIDNYRLPSPSTFAAVGLSRAYNIISNKTTGVLCVVYENLKQARETRGRSSVRACVVVDIGAAAVAVSKVLLLNIL